jgi:hypothetical protein
MHLCYNSIYLSYSYFKGGNWQGYIDKDSPALQFSVKRKPYPEKRPKYSDVCTLDIKPTIGTSEKEGIFNLAC